MDSTWENEDAPLLEAAVRYFEEEYDDGPLFPTIGVLADLAGFDEALAIRAVRRLSPTYLQVDDTLADHPADVLVTRVTDEARRAVGQWPTPNEWVDRIVEALQEAADRESDPVKKSRLRTVAEGLAGIGRDVLVNVLSGGITKAMGS